MSAKKSAAGGTRPPEVELTANGALNTGSAGKLQDPSVELYPFQTDCVNSLRAAFQTGMRKVLFVLPTGGGKTIVFGCIAAQAMRLGRRILIMVHRQELLGQTAKALARFGIEYGVIAAGYEPRPSSVQVASVMTAVRREIDEFDLTIVDEAHHAVAGSWRRIIDRLPNALVLGVTATPERLDGRGLGDVFDEMVVGPSTAELTRLGYLAPAAVYAPPTAPDLSDINIVAGDYNQRQLEGRMLTKGLVGDAVAQYRKRADGLPAIAFCVGIRHSKAVCEEFISAGYRAAHVDGETPDDERRDTMAALANGEIHLITNCMLISEGFDAPAVNAVLILRPTQSLALHLQMIGRALRPAPGKERAIVLDHAGNTLTHGLPTQDRNWSLNATRRRIVRAGADWSPVKKCPMCETLLPLTADNCWRCGHRFGRLIKTVPGELDEFAADPASLRAMSPRAAMLWAGRDRAKLRRVQIARGYKPGWVYYRMRETQSAMWSS
jgi:superfamily II DNA or RNA helicase